MNATGLTLLVPCYNAGRYLPRLAESVRAQTVPFAKILCYDDGSADNTVAVARSLGWQILTPNENGGPAQARNRLLAAASTEWVHFHDADDLLAPSHVETISAAIDARADVIVGQMDWVDEETRSCVLRWRYDAIALEQDPLAATIANPIGVIACAYRRETLLRVGGFDERFRTWEDGDLHVRLAAAGARFRVIPDLVSIGLRHGRGISSDPGLLSADRVRLLERYAIEYPAALPTIAGQAENLARELVANQGDRDQLRRLLALCARAGHPVPSSRNPLWRLLRLMVPPALALRIQHRVRAAAPASLAPRA